MRIAGAAVIGIERWQGEPVTPEQLAAELGVPAARIRAWLRGLWPRPAGGRWVLTDEQVTLARDRFTASVTRAEAPRARRPRTRADSDEAYVLDLVDAALSESGVRQHRFDWLLGDPNRHGARAALPVDGYWPGRRLIVEYRERQHDEPNALFDQRSTVSGVGRAEQRRRYDQLRDRLVPEHGLTLLVIRPDDLASNRGGRLRRIPGRDAISVQHLLAERGLLTAQQHRPTPEGYPDGRA